LHTYMDLANYRCFLGRKGSVQIPGLRDEIAVLSKDRDRYCCACGSYRVLLDFHMVKREGAAERRTRELKALAANGVLVYFEHPGKARVGALHIWPYSGRWFHETTGRSGRLHQITMKELIERQ
jgi:hypothetical protein